MKALTAVAFGLAAVFIAVFTLFYVFDQIQKLAASCANPDTATALCKQFTGFNESILIVVLIIAGFVIVITATAYILLSS